MRRRDAIEHQAILAAIRHHDADRAREAMVEHIRSFTRVIDALDVAQAKAS
jgi:DNA-binding GntR family transcriptional regulator